MKDVDLIKALEAIDEEALPNDWAREFQADVPRKFRQYKKLTPGQRSKVQELVAEHGELPGIVVGADGILSGPLPCGHDIQEVRKDSGTGVFCPSCFNS